ncbi:MAG TPA: Gfo/Idh/MocA family oxidoreductase [bacterium]|nr:Gfo/Idh/MocA family oxidoreductase [bacterium]
MISIGVVGYGYWGPNLVRNFMENEDLQVTMVADLKPENLAKAKKRYPSLRTTSRPEDLLEDPSLQAIAIATPVFTHFDLGLKALKAGKHVFMEKPLASNSQEAYQLVQEAARRGLVLFVDHTFLYTGAVRKIKEMVATGKLGKVHYYDSVRVNLGLFQHDINVLWDLAVHDLSIMDHLLDRRPTAISATGIAHVPKEPENIAYLTCFFEDDLIAHIHANWLAPVKIRKTLIGGDKQMIVYDDVEPTEKVKVYDKGITLTGDPEGLYKMLVSYRLGDVWSPKLDTTEALSLEADAFAEAILKGSRPLSDGVAGLRIVHILEAASRSMAQKGNPVTLDWKQFGL